MQEIDLLRITYYILLYSGCATSAGLHLRRARLIGSPLSARDVPRSAVGFSVVQTSQSDAIHLSECCWTTKRFLALSPPSAPSLVSERASLCDSSHGGVLSRRSFALDGHAHACPAISLLALSKCMKCGCGCCSSCCKARCKIFILACIRVQSISPGSRLHLRFKNHSTGSIFGSRLSAAVPQPRRPKTIVYRKIGRSLSTRSLRWDDSVALIALESLHQQRYWTP